MKNKTNKEQLINEEQLIQHIKIQGVKLSQEWMDEATLQPDNFLQNQYIEVVREASLNFLAISIFNSGMGAMECKTPEELQSFEPKWDASRGYALEKDIQDSITRRVQHLVRAYGSGELAVKRMV